MRIEVQVSFIIDVDNEGTIKNDAEQFTKSVVNIIKRHKWEAWFELYDHELLTWGELCQECKRGLAHTHTVDECGVKK